ncbi:hypothetical protein [Arthrobacter sp.]|uniref:phage portal protein family protein n=1 Tax=Arthrobacter sp. TaxID=1667 RepID=UPI003A8E54BA
MAIFDAMRAQDGKVDSVMQAVSMAITGARWELDAEGVDPEVAVLVRTELGMPAPGQPLRRRYGEGVVLTDHLAQLVETMLWAGLAVFEQVYLPAPPRPAQQRPGLATVVHLRKLAPGPRRTIVRDNLELVNRPNSVAQPQGVRVPLRARNEPGYSGAFFMPGGRGLSKIEGRIFASPALA